MTPRTFFSQFALSLAILVVTAAVGELRTTAAQAQFKEGDLVQQDDGSLYVFEGGELHLVQPVPASSSDVGGARMGSPVTTGVMIIPPPTAEAPLGEAPSSLRMTVLSVRRPAGQPPSAGREWAELRLRIENGTDRRWDTGAYLIGSNLNVWDARGSTSAATGAATDSLGSNFALQPGAAREGNLRFNVAAGVPLVRVIWTEGGATVMEAPIP